MSEKEPWKDRWDVLKRLSGGGHGDTFLVKDKKGGEGLFVLKKLKNQKSMERRERMYREVEAFRRLNHQQIPKVLEANTDEYGDISIPLYFIAEYVEGPTLEKVVETNPLDLNRAVKLTLTLTGIVEYCHNNGIHHRDIKPDNIIIRNHDLNDPVLIDFGQSFNEEEVNESRLTESWQQLGNRCLHLPELESRDSPKSYVESDITHCCGILFYALTGKCPVILIDEQGRKPHHRLSALKMFAPISPDVRRVLTKVFDRGFEYGLDDRFNSFPVFKGYLQDILDTEQKVAKKVAVRISRLEHLYEDILSLIDELVDRGDYAGAAALTRSFLGLEQPEKALQIVERMEERGGTNHPNYFIVLANKAYVMNNLGRYKDVINVIDQLIKELEKRGEHLAAYHALARANAHMNLGDEIEAKRWVDFAKTLPQFGNEREKSQRMYPSIAEYLTED